MMQELDITKENVAKSATNDDQSRHAGSTPAARCASKSGTYAASVEPSVARKRRKRRKRHHSDAPDGFPCSCGKSIDDPIHIPRILFLVLFLALSCTLLAAHHRRIPARPPALFANGEVARVAGTNKRVVIRAHRWNGREWIYAVEELRR